MSENEIELTMKPNEKIIEETTEVENEPYELNEPIQRAADMETPVRDTTGTGTGKKEDFKIELDKLILTNIKINSRLSHTVHKMTLKQKTILRPYLTNNPNRDSGGYRTGCTMIQLVDKIARSLIIDFAYDNNVGILALVGCTAFSALHQSIAVLSESLGK